jgi:cell division protein FtsL
VQNFVRQRKYRADIVRSENKNLGEIYAERAMSAPEPPASSISIPTIREPRDMVYSGSPATPYRPASSFSDAPAAAQNRKKTKRKVSPFAVMVGLFVLAVVSVLYIGNILAVGRLLGQINQLQNKHQQMLSEQEILRAQINGMAGLERIQQIAKDQLGMQQPKQLPVWIEINPERLRQIEEMLDQQVSQKH